MKFFPSVIRWLRRSLENPSVSLQDPEAWNEIFGGGTSASGAKVNRDTALAYAAVWRAVNLISDYVATLPLDIYERIENGAEKRTDHLAFRLLNRRPNEAMTPSVLRQTMQAHVLLQGNAYAYIRRATRGEPLELWPLSPDSTAPLRVNGELWYGAIINKEQRKIRPADVLHVKGLGFDGLVGYSVIDRARESMGLGIAARDYSSRFFGNNAEPRVVIEFPPNIRWTAEAQKQFISQWNMMHQGLENTHKIALVTGGANIKPFSLSAKDAQLIELREFEIREIANWFGVPPHKLGDTTRTAYASLEQENKALLQDCLNPWLIKWEEECWAKLLTQPERDADSHYFEFNRDALIQASIKEQAEALAINVNNGLLTLDEGRKIKNRPTVPGGLGAKHRMPVNIMIMGETPKQPVTAPAPADGSPPSTGQAAKRVVLDACRRAVKRVSVHARRAAEQPSKFLPWLDRMDADHGPVVQEILLPIVGLIRDGWTAAAISDETERVADELFRAIRDDLLRTSGECTASELAGRVSQRMDSHERFGPVALADVLFGSDKWNTDLPVE